MPTELVAGLILEENKILLVHNTKHNGLRIEPPGGKMEAGESAKEATVREVKEELGVDVEVEDLLGIFNTQSPEGDFPVHMFFCKITSGKLAIKEPNKISFYRWYTFEQLNAIRKSGTLVPNMVQALETLKKYLT